MTRTNTNDLLERYLQAVGEYLPSATKADMLAELRANLLDQMEAREDELGRSQTEDDVAAVLRAHGKPELVALRYLPQRSLIGPTIYPFYLYTLRKAAPLVLLIYAVAQGATLLAQASTGDALAAGITSAVFQLIPTVLIFWAAVTIVFVVIEANKGHEQVMAKLSQWDPVKLPALKATTGEEQKSFASRVVDLCVHLLWMAYVLVLPRHPFWILGPGTLVLSKLGVGFAPVWHTFYVLLVAVLLIQLGMKVLALRNGTHLWLKPMKLATDALGAVALAIVACSKAVFVPVMPSADVATIAQVNHVTLFAMKIALAFAVAGLAKEAWEAAQKKVPAGQLAF